jgi:hypothetical protein
MSRALAPSRLPRQQRRRIDRALRRLSRPGVCSFCGRSFRHNSRTAGGLDAHGNVALAGECCFFGRVAEVFAMGLYSDRRYDFLFPRGTKPDIEPTSEQIADAITACQEVITATDKRLDSIERYGGGVRGTHVNVLDHPWTDDDRNWFAQNQERSHRARMPFPGEADKEAAGTPAGHALIVLLRQVEPGSRIRAGFYLNADLMPLPDDEATAHGLFEMAVGREAVPSDRQALCALIEKYTGRQT